MVSPTNKSNDGGRKPSYAAIRQGKKIVDLIESLIATTPAAVKGGKQPGAGRPPGPPTITVRIRLSPAQHAAYVERGSERWLKRVLSEANENQTEKKK